MNIENRLRDQICECGRSLFNRGLTFGSAGNISVALPSGGWLMTPTNISLGELDPAKLAKIDESGNHMSGEKPTKEAFLHRVMYSKRNKKCEAVIHLHSTHAVAVSCMHGIDEHNCLPPLTAYYVMRVGQLPLVPYHPPGDENLAKAVGKLATYHHAVLLANHGPVVSGTSLSTALYATEELEETAKLFLLLRGSDTRPLLPSQVDELIKKFSS